MQTFRESLNNLIRSDKPESPTDVVFLYGSLMLINAMVYAVAAKVPIPHITEMIGFLVLCKGVKVGSDWQKQRKAACDEPPTDNTLPAQ